LGTAVDDRPFDDVLGLAVDLVVRQIRVDVDRALVNLGPLEGRSAARVLDLEDEVADLRHLAEDVDQVGVERPIRQHRLRIERRRQLQRV
jgi:hypothetical protein